MKKENKIMVVVSQDPHERDYMIRQLLVRLGFAAIQSDAGKIIKEDIYSIDLSQAYFVVCSNYNFRDSMLITQRLYEMAARGIAVIVGIPSLPRGLEFICQAFYNTDFNH